MNVAMKAAHEELARLVDTHPSTTGLRLHVRGSVITLSREVVSPAGTTERDDRVRLTHLGGSLFGLSVLRHTGKWQKTPFSGTVAELFEALCAALQHVAADWP